MIKGILLVLLIATLGMFMACPSPVASPAPSSSSAAPVAVTAVSLDRSTLVIAPGSSFSFTCTVQPANASDKSLAWSSSDSSIASVSAGTVTGVAIGSATITVTSNDGSRTASCSVSVAPGLVINEVTFAYYSNYPVAIEVFNPTGSTINLNQYGLRTPAYNYNGTYNFTSSLTFTLPSLPIAPGAYAAIRSKVSANFESGGNTVYLDDGQSPDNYPWFSASSGYAELLRGGATVDFVRWGGSGTSPTSAGFWGTNASTSGIPSDATSIGYALARDANSTSTRTGADWTLRAWSTLGGKNDVTADADADGDGIPDSSEAAATTFAGQPLYTWGARTGQKDIFINIDYMVNGSVGATDPGLIPQKAALDKVVAAFAAMGYTVHFDVGDLFGVGVANYNLDGRSHAVAWNGSISLGLNAGYANVYKYKADSLPLAKSKVFFYMLFADTQSSPAADYGSSGIANLPGNTAIISLGHWHLSTSPAANLNALVNYQAATVMHEFGHNLGLKHGGDENFNYKPNYFSVMNYLYQLDGLPTAGNEDTRYYAQYKQSHGSIIAAWSARTSGWSDGPDTAGFAFSYSDGSGAVISQSGASETGGNGRAGSAGIDYNMNGVVSGTQAVNEWFNVSTVWSAGPSDSMHDFNDWGAISSVFQRSYAGVNSGASAQATVPSGEMRAIFNNPDPASSEPCAPNPRHNLGPVLP